MGEMINYSGNSELKLLIHKFLLNSLNLMHLATARIGHVHLLRDAAGIPHGCFQKASAYPVFAFSHLFIQQFGLLGTR